MGDAKKADSPDHIGRYQVMRKLGEGGMGVVYAAHDPSLDREVALKHVRADRLRGRPEEASQRLRTEAQITAKLAHPHVVTIYEVGECVGGVYIAMELVDGPSLRQWLSQEARPWSEVLAMFFQAGRGLAAAHRAGLIHRDFKPGNVLIGNNRARVVDFGLAHSGSVSVGRMVANPADVTITTSASPSSRVNLLSSTATEVTQDDFLEPGRDDGDVLSTSQLDVTSTQSIEESSIGVTTDGVGPTTVRGGPMTSTGRFVGTPAYMAPELFSGGIAGERTDQFAFAVSLYEGLYGERPFAGDTTGEIAREVLAGNVRAAPDGTRVPGWLRNIIVTALCVDPAQRHPSIKSMLASVAFTSRVIFGA